MKVIVCDFCKKQFRHAVPFRYRASPEFVSDGTEMVAHTETRDVCLECLVGRLERAMAMNYSNMVAKAMSKEPQP